MMFYLRKIEVFRVEGSRWELFWDLFDGRGCLEAFWELEAMRLDIGGLKLENGRLLEESRCDPLF